ncbi:hypothetical protein ACT7DB_17360 [Bacillus cereus]
MTEELDSYIKEYQVQIWSEPPQIISPGSSQYQFSNEQGVRITFKPDKTEIKAGQEQDKITITVNLVNGRSVQVYSALPVPHISKEDIKATHQIENWIYDWNGDHVSTFYFNQKIEPSLKYIHYYSIKIDGQEYQPKEYVTRQTLQLEEEQDHKENKGLAIRLEWFGFTGGKGHEFPQPGRKLDVIAHLKDHDTLEVVKNYEIPPKP